MASYDDTATVSGSVVSFSNGADDVPTKSLVVTIPPTLTGVSALNETQIPSSNMASMSDADFTLNGVHYYTENGVLYIDGTSTSETSSDNNAFKVLDFWLPSGIYYFSRGATLTSLNVPAYLRKYDDKSQIVVNTGSFTLSEKTHLYIAFYVYQKVFSNIKAEICISLGSTSITYVDPVAPTTYSANLGRTVYGAEVDLVNGTGTEKNSEPLTFDGSEDWRADTIRNGVYLLFSTMGIQNFGDGICNMFATIETGSGLNSLGICFGVNNYAIYIPHLFDGSIPEVTDVATWQTYLSSHDCTISYPLAAQIDFTFDGQEVPTRLGYNAFWSEQGDTELTYYKDGYGFTSVTVNKLQGKNLASELLEWNQNNRVIPPVFLKAGTYTVSFTRSTTPSAIYIRKGNTIVLSGNAYAYKYNSNSFTFNADVDGYYYIQICRSASSTTWEDAPITNPQLEMGSVQTDYEPYVAPVSKTAYLHKVIYGGKADVIRGTCEPKNLFDDSTFPRTATDNTYYAQFQSNLAEGNKYKIPTIHIEPDVAYVLSFDVECDTEPFNASVGIGIGSYSRDIANANNNTSGRISVPFTLTSALKEQYGDILSFRVPRYSSPREFTFTISNVQLEKASSASEYVPYFDPFTFPPINMETDEGENTLFANEGASAITYRKETD